MRISWLLTYTVICRDSEVASLKRKVEVLEQQLRDALGAEFAAIMKRCGGPVRRNRSWAKSPEKGSLLDPLWQQGLNVDELYSHKGSI